METDNTLILALQRHTGTSANKTTQCFETHLSWILITGKVAYKIKKPLNLGFQDFTTLEKRRYYCDLEITLNKRLAPELYVGVVPITGTPEHPQLEGQGEAIEYAIKMHAFDQSSLLDAKAEAGFLTPSLVMRLCEKLACFHITAQVCDASNNFGTPENVNAPVLDNFNALYKQPFTTPFHESLKHIEKWSQDTYHKYKPLLGRRKKEGFIKACHGDLHLRNIFLQGDEPVIFDCIEFNENFRWIDVYADVGFLSMDLEHFKFPGLSHLLINHYIEQTNDIEGVLLLKYYQSYRAMVRAKISAFQYIQTTKIQVQEKLKKDFTDFLNLATQYTAFATPTLSVTVGYSGSGKSIFTKSKMQETGAIRLSSDAIRKHLFKIPLTQRPTDEQREVLYSTENTERVYQHMAALANMLLENGMSVIVDATCLQHEHRKLFHDLAKSRNIHYALWYFDMPLTTLEANLAKREKQANTVSDANKKVLYLQKNHFDPLTEEELAFSEIIHPEHIAQLMKQA